MDLFAIPIVSGYVYLPKLYLLFCVFFVGAKNRLMWGDGQDL